MAEGRTSPMKGRSVRAALCVAALAIAGCVSMPGGFYDSAPLDDPAVGGCGWTGRYASPVVYTESDHIRAYFEPANLAAYRQAIGSVFTMPERPLIRVSFLDFYGMANGPGDPIGARQPPPTPRGRRAPGRVLGPEAAALFARARQITAEGENHAVTFAVAVLPTRSRST